MLVDEDIVKLTLPEGRQAKEHLGKFYVGSAEQSFYQLIKDGFVPKGNYMMLTPCQRDEDIDEGHLEIFLKLELVSVTKTHQNIAQDVFDFYTKMGEKVEVVSSNYSRGCDLEIGGIEVGSFGSRMFGDYCVSYGTGLALPRFTQARQYKPIDNLK